MFTPDLTKSDEITKPQARKITTYLTKILDDALRYSYDKRPGRKRKSSK